MRKLILVIIALATIACAKIEDRYYKDNNFLVNHKGEYAILFNNKTKASINTVSGTGYDDFALFVWNSNGDTIMNPYKVFAKNINEYEYADTLGQTLKYFSNTASNYDFVGIIPSNKNMSLSRDTVKVDSLKSFIVDDNRVSGTLIAESSEEFLWSYKEVLKSEYANVVDLSFNHGNALVYLGFSSDRTDTKLIDYVPGTADTPAVPEQRDTTDVCINLKRSSNVDISASRTSTDGGTTYVDNFEIPAALVAEIKSYYSINGGDPGDYDLHLTNSNWPSADIWKLRIVKDIPAAYKLTIEIPGGNTVDVFNALKYLEDNGYKMTSRISGGKPAIFTYPILDMFVNGTAFSVVGFNFGVSTIYDASVAGNIPTIEYTINVTPEIPAIPGQPAIEGIRVFSADSIGINNLPTDTLYCVHIPHTTVADAFISNIGCKFSNRLTSDDVIQFSLPSITTLNTTPVWSPSTFYAIPGDSNFNFIVVKISYIYNGVTAYDVRVPICFPNGGLQAGKYYKYEIHITSTSTGTNDPVEASDEKDEILIEDLHPIVVNLSYTDYSLGANQKIII